MIDSFEEFLKNKKQAEKPVDWTLRKQNWINSIDSLYKDIKEWLNPFVASSLLIVKEKKISVYEEFIGDYTITQLDIAVGTDIISLIPKGTLILGSYGRIDVRGPKDDIMIVEQKWNEWKFVDKYNRSKRWSFTEESFKTIIQKLING